MGQEAPYKSPKFHPKREKVETIEILRKAKLFNLYVAEP